MRHLRTFKTALGILAISAVACFGQPSSNAQFPANQAISAADCTAEHLGTIIPVSAIGESPRRLLHRWPDGADR